MVVTHIKILEKNKPFVQAFLSVQPTHILRADQEVLSCQEVPAVNFINDKRTNISYEHCFL